MNIWALKPGSVVIHIRPTEIVTDIIPGNFSQGCWCTSQEIIERGELFKIQHAYSPPGYFEYVRPEDLRSIG